MKTYSLVFYNRTEKEYDGKPYECWFYNWHQTNSLDEFDWKRLLEYIKEKDKCLKIAYQYCYESRNEHPRVKKNVVFEKTADGKISILRPELLDY